MAREGVDLYNIEQLDPSDNMSLRDFVFRLRRDFDSHNHDGSSSRQLDNIIAQTIQVRSAIVGGYKLYEAVVGPSAADYKTVAEALKAGKKRIFVRNGTYTNEPTWELTSAGTTIVGESVGGVDITFAQDTVNSGSKRCIHINANNITTANMTLRSYADGNQLLFRLNTSKYFLAENLRLQNTRDVIFRGIVSNLYATIRNCVFDYSTISDTTNAKAFNNLDDSFVLSCFFDITSSSSGWVLATACQRTLFMQCRIVNTQNSTFDITTSDESMFVGCYFKIKSLNLNTNLESCILENNGNDPATYFLTVSTFGVRVNNSRIILDNDHNVISCTSSNCQFLNNYIDGGKKVLIQNGSTVIYGNQFCNNNWVSDYTTAAMDLELGGNGDYSMILGNVIRNNSGSFVPTITDGGTSTIGVATNQLIGT